MIIIPSMDFPLQDVKRNPEEPRAIRNVRIMVALKLYIRRFI